jgi:plasmid stabilization system protein ParE
VSTTYRVIVAPEAHDDLRDILENVAQFSPQNAAGLIDTVIDAITSLSLMPNRYAVARGSRRFPFKVRCMPVPPYRITYRVIEKFHVVRVLRVEHGSRDH